MAPGANTPSPPFASRELNGQVLLEELGELMQAQIAQRHLDDCVAGLRDLDGIRVSEASARLKHLAANRFSSQPALGRLLVEWAGKVKVEADIPLLKNHFFRLAMASAVLSALRRGAERLPRSNRR
jgi:hypothetical protein